VQKLGIIAYSRLADDPAAAARLVAKVWRCRL
jgi:hypothetical protein